MRSRHVYGRGFGVGDAGGVVGVVPKANRNATEERFSAEFDKKVSLDMKDKENGRGASRGSPPQAIWGHYRLLSDIQYIFTLRYCTAEGFLQHLGSFRPVPGPLILLRDSSGMTLIYGNILNAGSAPFFSFLLFGLFFHSIKEERVRRDILNS